MNVQSSSTEDGCSLFLRMNEIERQDKREIQRSLDEKKKHMTMLNLKRVEEYLFTATNGQEKRTHEVYSWLYTNPILNDQFLQLQENDGGLLFNGIKISF